MAYTDEQYEQLQLALRTAVDSKVLSAHSVVAVLGEVTTRLLAVEAEEVALARALRQRSSVL